VFRIAKLPHLGQTTCLGYGLRSTVFGLQSGFCRLESAASGQDGR